MVDVSANDNTVSAPAAGGQDIMSALAGLTISPSLNPPSSVPLLEAQPTQPRLTTGANVDRWFDKLTYVAEGVLYEDVQIQVGIKSRYQSHIGQLAVYLGNKVDAPLTSFTATIHVSDPEALSVSFAKIPPSTIASRSQTQQLLHVECKKVFTTPPILTVSFLAGSHQAISIRLPIVLTKFFEHVKLGQSDFFERWKLIGGEREAQSIFPVELTSAGQLDLTKHRQVVSGHRINVLEEIDPNPNNLVGAGVLHMSIDGKVGCLLRLEPNREAKLCRLTVRSTSGDVATEVQKLVQKPLMASQAP
jgi:AP-2 complex subunit alpha